MQLVKIYVFSADAMNKICKSSLCVEKVRESYVLIGQRVVEVPGGADAIRLALLILISVRLRLCCNLFLERAFSAEDICARKIQRDSLDGRQTSAGTC